MASSGPPDEERTSDRTSAPADRDRPGIDSDDRGATDHPPRANGGRTATGTGEWLAASTLRIVLAVVGLVVLLFGLGMAMGVDLLGAIVDVLNTEVGRWLLVALVGLVVLIVAVRGFGVYYRG